MHKNMKTLHYLDIIAYWRGLNVELVFGVYIILCFPSFEVEIKNKTLVWQTWIEWQSLVALSRFLSNSKDFWINYSKFRERRKVSHLKILLLSLLFLKCPILKNITIFKILPVPLGHEWNFNFVNCFNWIKVLCP